jgi:hypothetical protein
MKRFKNILLDATSIKQAAKNHMKSYGIAAATAIIGLMLIFTAHAQNHAVQPTVFQAAGPDASSIQGTVEQFRLALGGVNNLNKVGPIDTGRREINWDGGSSANTATSTGPTPFDGFLSTRGTRFTTGSGFIQATPKGLADFFGNPSYETIFKAFSPSRLFSPIGSNVTDTSFFVPSGVPGVSGAPATTRGFGVVFSDVDLPGGNISILNRGNRPQSTLIEYFSADGQLLFSSLAPASPGNGNMTFFGVVFGDARIARVRISTGAPPGPDDSRTQDVVMMDDFIYGEPQPIQ